MLQMTTIDNSVDKTGCISKQSVLVMVHPWVEGLIRVLAIDSTEVSERRSDEPWRGGLVPFQKGGNELWRFAQNAGPSWGKE